MSAVLLLVSMSTELSLGMNGSTGISVSIVTNSGTFDGVSNVTTDLGVVARGVTGGVVRAAGVGLLVGVLARGVGDGALGAGTGLGKAGGWVSASGGAGAV